MKKSIVRGMQAGACLICCYSAYAEKQSTADKLASLYKHVGDELVSIRKEFPQSQRKVYMVLDKIDQLYNASKLSCEKKRRFKELLKTRDKENSSLNNEVIVLKSELDAVNGKLDTITQNYSLTQSKMHKLALENKELVTREVVRSKQEEDAQVRAQRVKEFKNREHAEGENFAEKSLKREEAFASLDKNHSFNLTSTSDPSSPR